MLVTQDRAAADMPRNHSHVLTMVRDSGEIWHRLTFVDAGGVTVTIFMSPEEARDLFLALKVSVDKEPGNG